MDKMTNTESKSHKDQKRNGQGAPAGKVLVAGLAGLVVALFLNSSALLADAQRQPDGTGRSVALAVWRPIESVASSLGLTWPRATGDRLLGRSEAEQVITLLLEKIEVVDTSEKDNWIVPSVQTEQEPRKVTGEERRAPLEPDWDADNPFQLWILGDSMVRFFGDTLVSLAETSTRVQATSEPVLSSGLTRPDYFDWPARLTEIMAKHDPDAVVIIVGGNDAQNIRTENGQWLERFNEAWSDEYRRRIGTVMDLVTSDAGRVLLWVGQPPMREEGFDQRMQLLNNLYQAEAAERERVQYVDLRELFTDSSGGYSRYLPDNAGKLVDVRLTDGVHLSHWGGEWLSALLLRELRRSPSVDELWVR
jgi:hypothetical protein